MSLSEKEPLIKLNNALNSNKKIYCYKKHNGYSKNSIEYKLTFCSFQLVSDLEKWGCVENKTFKLKFPSFLPKELIRHFIRGYFDGDGSVFLHKQKSKNKNYIYLGITICGIKNFLLKITNIINIKNCVYKDTRKETDCYSIKLNSNIRCLKLYHYLYNNATVYLSRKRQIFENFIKNRGSTTIISNPTNSLYYLED